MSHGRTGTRVSYTQFCESLAGCGAVVAAPDHVGDTLGAWLAGTQSDDATNESQRLTDAHQLVEAFLQGHPDLPHELAERVDRRKVAVAGHSYGAFTAYGAAGGARGVPAQSAVRAVVGLQPYLRSLSENALARVGAASLLVVGGRDDVTPADSDADRGWSFVPGRPSWRLDLPGHGHQACSDIALYAELVEHVPDLPQLVRDYLMATAAGTSGPGIRPWRDVLRDQVLTTWAFLSGVFAGEAHPAGPDLGDSDSQLQRR
jgi:predicted dienelactone hydrolase